jgi:hypothetical protein
MLTLSASTASNLSAGNHSGYSGNPHILRGSAFQWSKKSKTPSIWSKEKATNKSTIITNKVFQKNSVVNTPAADTLNHDIFKVECRPDHHGIDDRRSSSTIMSRSSEQPSSSSPSIARGSNTSQQTLQDANRLVRSSYDLVWNGRPLDAIPMLEAARKLQVEFLGKHHIDVGWTCNYIGTAYWQSGEQHQKCSCDNNNEKYAKEGRAVLSPSYFLSALKYYLEARRIFCKSTMDTSSHCRRQQNNIKSLDRRIECILTVRLGWSDVDVKHYLSTLEKAIEHEREGDRQKVLGNATKANEELRKARQLLAFLMKPFHASP